MVVVVLAVVDTDVGGDVDVDELVTARSRRILHPSPGTLTLILPPGAVTLPMDVPRSFESPCASPEA